MLVVMFLTFHCILYAVDIVWYVGEYKNSKLPKKYRESIKNSLAYSVVMLAAESILAVDIMAVFPKEIQYDIVL